MLKKFALWELSPKASGRGKVVNAFCIPGQTGGEVIRMLSSRAKAIDSVQSAEIMRHVIQGAIYPSSALGKKHYEKP